MQTGPNLEKQERTRKKIQDAFMKLYKKNTLEKISMRQVAELAGVTRSTVYVYFDSVYDILEVIEQELYEGLGTYFEQYSGDMLEKNSEAQQDSTVKWFKYCMANRNYLLALLGPSGDPSFEYKLRKRLKVDLNRMMDEDGMRNDYLRKYAVEYMAGATISLMRYWLECNENLPAEDIASVANVIRQSKTMIEQMHENAESDEKNKNI